MCAERELDLKARPKSETTLMYLTVNGLFLVFEQFCNDINFAESAVRAVQTVASESGMFESLGCFWPRRGSEFGNLPEPELFLWTLRFRQRARHDMYIMMRD